MFFDSIFGTFGDGYMCFEDEFALKQFLRNMKVIGRGAQGVCYSNGVYVFKIFYDELAALSQINLDTLRTLSFLTNDTFLFSNDIIWVRDKFCGTVMPYRKGYNLYEIDPLSVPLLFFVSCVKKNLEDLKTISHFGVEIQDLFCNMLLGDHMFVVDTQDYRINEPSLYVENFNLSIYQQAIMSFLIDGCFEKFVSTVPYLRKMYKSYENEGSILEFLQIFQKELSELVGAPILTLEDAKECLDDAYTCKKFSKNYRNFK